VIAVGIDAHKQGWVALGLVDGRVDRVWSAPTLATLLDGTPRDAVVGIDVPLGGLATQWRAADGAAGRLLGVRRSSVFAIPPRPVWDAPTFAAANVLCRELTGQGLSRQAYNLRLRMLEAEVYRDSARHELHEVHPEAVFHTMAGGPLAYRKKTWNGQMARRALLAAAGVLVPDELPEAGAVPADDVLDAAAVAWCAHRIATGEASHVPDPPDEHDDRGRPIVIWAG
jgi:predicted RNase H-like nuclease